MTERVQTSDLKRACQGACNLPGADRRDFLFAAGASMVALSAPGLFAGTVQAKVASYPRQAVGAFSKLKRGEPMEFRYPWDHENCESVLARLDREAAGGIGPDKDVVAFNGLCPHMGWSIPARHFYSAPGIAGPCPGHWTTFDLTRYGMVVSGHATQGLPQVILELDGDEIVAVGMLGLIFGFSDNKVEPKA